MKQIVHLNEQIKDEVASIEVKCMEIGRKLQNMYENDFRSLGETFIIELVRERKGKPARIEELFLDGYESYLEIGVEKNEVYFPNGYIPIWKCKQEMFHHVGCVISFSLEALEVKLKQLIDEIYEDHRRELEEK
ncbi:hypothetical protein [Bacillus sp. S/N-304-OC-R1]|uniref:hypothetical protein n=1 Tax=Bacillus sp. S/N-304-OC-R1 TaxID=2758034 RepID=UPI001C8F00AC|nr:hypothetical protein [Bacillus sp. S/N-304-OC-R1]MBY0124545.1 hypothetical protein [Bacillus sp. S/N-304-OC-R1]